MAVPLWKRVLLSQTGEGERRSVSKSSQGQEWRHMLAVPAFGKQKAELLLPARGRPVLHSNWPGKKIN